MRETYLCSLVVELQLLSKLSFMIHSKIQKTNVWTNVTEGSNVHGPSVLPHKPIHRCVDFT